MIVFATVENHRLAQAFIDYMATQNQPIEIQVDHDRVQLLVSQVSYEWVLLEWQRFLLNPEDKKYQSASWQVLNTKPLFSYPTTPWVSLLRQQAGWLTLMLMALCIGVFFLLQLPTANNVFALLHFPASDEQQWQLWRWFSHALLHFSTIHIAFNLLWWWQLGGSVEKRLSSGKLMQVLLLSAFVSGAGQFWVSGANFGGLSGVVYALLGYCWILGHRSPHLGIGLSKPTVGFMLVWLVLGYLQPFLAIANTAHLAGLIVGVLMAFVDGSKEKYR
ncbi:rhomboid family intramembrane serine protease GlpG [Vibrio sp. HB161653]